jgi:hypothetical protein
MSDFLIPDFQSHLDSINRSRADKGLAPIKQGDWSAFLSGTGARVRQVWINEMRAGRHISEDKALALLAALNAILQSLNMPTIRAATLQKLSRVA